MTYTEKKKLLKTYGKDLIKFLGWPKPYKVPLIDKKDLGYIDLSKNIDKYKYELPTPKL